MASKELKSDNIDNVASNEATTYPADGYYKNPKAKNLGGRPKKDGLKNEQFTLTMHPELYEKLRIIAKEYTRGNFSALIDDAVKVYCSKNGINLTEIEVDPNTLDIYRQKQEKKAKRKK